MNAERVWRQSGRVRSEGPIHVTGALACLADGELRVSASGGGGRLQPGVPPNRAYQAALYNLGSNKTN
jgi:hypothetical protein